MPPIRLSLFGHFSSHGLPSHHLPAEFQRANINARYLPPVWLAQGGGLIDQNRVDQIIHIMNREHALGSRQVHLMCLGSNNLGDPDTDWTPQDVHDMHQQVVFHAQTLTNIHIVICGILPRPCNNDETFARFSVATSMLKKLSNEHKPLTSFVNIPKAFNTYGVVHKSLFTPVRQLHLTEEGARVLARILKNHLENWPKRYF